MATFLFSEIIFGPVESRRLGVSLGINLLPNDSKLCNFNCIYCECGWTPEQLEVKNAFHPRAAVSQALDEKLAYMKQHNKPIDSITYAGNGEPTMHPEFEQIIDDTIELKDKYFPKAKITVLSNATMLHKSSVVAALKKVTYNILKLDTVVEESYNLINNSKGIGLQKIKDSLRQFNGDLIIQTMFLRGTYNNKTVDNATEEEVNAWLSEIKEINPKQVMIYTFKRDTPLQTLEKVSLDELNEIAEKVRRLGIDVQVKG